MMKIMFFIKKPDEKKKGPRTPITSMEECQINQELRDVWLKKDQ